MEVGSVRRTKGFPMTASLKQQNGKLEIPCKRTNQRLWVCTFLTDVDLDVMS